jgi:dolichyl-phosphate-mannose-protein mannosyltransferase
VRARDEERRVSIASPIVRGLALSSYAALLFSTAPSWPDDWDGVGFVESVRDFDLASFRPHPPGYPVYVALLRAAAVLVGAPIRACVLVAVASGAVAIAFAWDAARRASGDRAAWMVATLVGTSPGVWRACSGVGSEAPALACGAACVWALAVSHERPGSIASWIAPTALGVAAGLGLGVRLSWGPLYVAALAIAPRGGRARARWTAAAACAAWVVPLVLAVGAARLWELSAQHFSGHAARWGGTMATEPGSVRLVWLARDLFVDGLGAGSDALGLATGVLLVLAATLALACWRAARWRGWQSALVVVTPYLLWIGLGQNLRDQPRHALPLVVLLAAGLSLPSGRARGALPVAAALAVAASIRTAADAKARRSIPPPGEQLVELARMQPSPNRLAVFGGASVRFFETTELASRALVAGSLGDVRMDLTHLDELPSRVWVTSEIAGLSDSRWPLERVADLCRPPRLDRRMPCLAVYTWKLPFLR